MILFCRNEVLSEDVAGERVVEMAVIQVRIFLFYCIEILLSQVGVQLNFIILWDSSHPCLREQPT